MFHNTTHESGDYLDQLIQAAETQEDKIRALFEHWNQDPLTPFEVQRFALPGAPVTSVRRAMTNLTNEGVLVKTTFKKLGDFGRPCYTWKLASPQGELSLG